MLKITQFTDPMCIWCYGLEPALRKLKYIKKDEVEFHNILGLLVGDVSEIIGDDEFADIRFRQLKTQMSQHFIEASERSGIPVSIKHMEKRTKKDITSVPMSLAFEAMKLISEDEANKFLRCMREAAHSYDLNTSDMDVLADLAGKYDIDILEFKNNIESGKAIEALDEDIAICRKHGINSFPTMVIEYEGKKQIINGYVTYDILKSHIFNLTGPEFALEEVEFSLENVSDFVNYFNKVAACEIKMAFDLDDSQLEDIVQKLIDSGLFEKEECGNSYFIKERLLLKCDSKTGVCNF